MRTRLAYIDYARGLLILMMLAIHATLPLQDAAKHAILTLPLIHSATFGFVMIAGYLIAIRVPTLTTYRSLYTRSGMLIAVMIYTNWGMALGKFLLSRPDGPRTFQDLAAVPLQFGGYNISGVLLPIAALYLLAPLLYRSEQRIGLTAYVAWGLGLIGLSEFGAALTSPIGAVQDVLGILFVDGLGGFTVTHFLTYGIVGFAMARLLSLSSGQSTQAIVIGLIGSLFVLDAFSPTHETPSTALLLLDESIHYAALLGLIMATAWLLAKVNLLSGLALLGQYALFAFVVHRIIVHALMPVFSRMSGDLFTFAFTFAVTLILTYAACSARVHSLRLDELCAKAYL